MTRSPLALLLAGGLALAACGSAADDGPVSPIAGGASSTAEAAPASTAAPAGSTPTTGAPTTTTTAAGAVATERPLAGFTTRSVDYDLFTITVTEALVSNEDPGTFRGTRPAELGDATYAYLQVRLTNRLKLTEDFLGSDEVTLTPAGGRALPTAEMLGQAGAIVARGSTAEGWLAFELASGQTLDGAVLTFGEPGFEGRTLPLTGTVPTPAYPVAITLQTPIDVMIDRTGWRIDITKASLDTWVGFDGDKGAVVTDHAREGRRKLLLTFKATITAPEEGEKSDFIPYDAVRLVVNGDRLSDSPEEGDGPSVTVGATGTGYFVLDIPARGTVELEWGDLTDNPVRVPVPLP